MKYSSIKRTVLLTLVLALFTGCGNTSVNNKESDVTATETNAVVSAEVPRDNLPQDLDFGGRIVHITVGDYCDGLWDDMYVEEATGNRLDDAIYNANVNVEQRLNVELEYTRERLTWSTMSDYQTKIISQILAGDAGFDLLFSGGTNFSSMTSDGHYFGNLAELKYVNLDSPWYNQSAIECVPDDYVDFVMGEFAIGNVKNTYCMYFNQSLLDDMQIDEDMYAVVDSGKWTLDKLSELIKGGYSDLNGNTEQDANDRYGLTFGDQNKYCGFIKSCGVDTYTLTDDGFVFEYDSERAVNAIQKLRSIIYDSGEARYALSSNGDEDWQYATGGSNYASKPFVNGNSMFACGLVADAEVLAPTLTFEWGILPYPKYDESMENYQSYLQRYIYAMIPVTLEDTDATGAVLEALSSEIYHDVIPEYVEVSLKVRYSPDEGTSRMFDIIRNNIVSDPGQVYSNLLDYPETIFKGALYENANEWTSIIAAKKDMLNEKMSVIRPVVSK